MKDYAKVINSSKEMHGREQAKKTLAHSAVEKSRTAPKSSQSAKKRSGSGFFALVAIFIVIAILLAVYRQYMHHNKAETAKNTTSTSATAKQKAANPQFDFYSVLPSGANPNGAPSSSTTVQANNSTTTTAQQGAAAPAASSSSASTAAPVQTINTVPKQYYLEAGEFANKADAQQMLSQLLLLGTQANIKSVQDNGAPSYQVLVGPFDDSDAMNIVRNQLQAHQIQTKLVKQ